MEKLADLPPAALITFGVTLAVIFAVQRFGLWQGQKSEPASGDRAVVASVIVDPTALNHATAAAEELAEAMREAVKQGEDNAHMVCRRVEALTDALRTQTAAIGALTLEVARRPRSAD